MPVRNEDWVLGLSARAALLWCDELVILDHASTDRSAEIIRDVAREHSGRVLVMNERNPEWREMQHRQAMLEWARNGAGTHIAIVDADEVLTGNLLPAMRSRVENLRPGQILQLPGYNLRGSIGRYHANGIWGNRIFSLAFPDDGCANWHGDQFHHREPFGYPLSPCRPLTQGQGGIMHLWGADERRLVAKHALYKMTERIRWPSKPVSEIERLYSLAIHECFSDGTQFACKWEYSGVPSTWWEPYREFLKYLDLPAIPWQEAEARRLWLEYGAERFAGLDLFGVAARKLFG